MADNIQESPSLKDLCEGKYTYKQWLTYYKNIWTRNLMARSIDVQTDMALKAKNPEESVQDDQGRQVPVKVRLEIRKMYVQDALDLIAGIDKLIEVKDEEFEAKVLSKEALAVAEDMLPKKVGDTCKTEAGVDGTFQETVAAKDGQPAKLTCIPVGKTAEEFLKEKVEAEKTPATTEVKPE